MYQYLGWPYPRMHVEEKLYRSWVGQKLQYQPKTRKPKKIVKPQYYSSSGAEKLIIKINNLISRFKSPDGEGCTSSSDLNLEVSRYCYRFGTEI